MLEGFDILDKNKNRYLVKIPEKSNSKELIIEILKSSEIVSFKEKIPSMEDIFINTVQNG